MTCCWSTLELELARADANAEAVALPAVELLSTNALTNADAKAVEVALPDAVADAAA